MSKQVKELVRKELARRFEGVTSLAVVGLTGVSAVMNNNIRGRLLEKNIRITVVKNSLARQTFNDMGLPAAADLLDGPCALAYGVGPDQVEVVTIVRELLDIGKDVPTLTVKAALLEGEKFGPEQIDRLSKFPTHQESLSQLVSCALSAGSKLAACIITPGGKIASLLKAIEEKQSESSGAL
ncbi:MAG: 50S ribosomal protein L10 [Planctomycetota bacterium]|nr:50S ribosomal protein L10 [Planctomycetota bacterium]